MAPGRKRRIKMTTNIWLEQLSGLQQEQVLKVRVRRLILRYSKLISEYNKLAVGFWV